MLRAHTSPAPEPAQDVSIHAAVTPHGGRCDPQGAQGTPGTPTRRWHHPRVLCVPRAPAGRHRRCPCPARGSGKPRSAPLAGQSSPHGLSGLGTSTKAGPVTKGGVSLPGATEGSPRCVPAGAAVPGLAVPIRSGGLRSRATTAAVAEGWGQCPAGAGRGLPWDPQ